MVQVDIVVNGLIPTEEKAAWEEISRRFGR